MSSGHALRYVQRRRLATTRRKSRNLLLGSGGSSSRCRVSRDSSQRAIQLATIHLWTSKRIVCRLLRPSRCNFVETLSCPRTSVARQQTRVQRRMVNLRFPSNCGPIRPVETRRREFLRWLSRAMLSEPTPKSRGNSSEEEFEEEQIPAPVLSGCFHNELGIIRGGLLN